MLELDPKGPTHAASFEGRTYELHSRRDTNGEVLAAFDGSHKVLWTAAVHLGEVSPREMSIVRDPVTNRLLLTVDGEHWRGGTPLAKRWLLEPEGSPVELDDLAPGALAALDETQRRAVLAVFVLVATADGKVDPLEVALLRPLFEGEAWGAPTATVLSDMQHAQRIAKGTRSLAEVCELGRAALGLPLARREELARRLLRIAWADSAVRSKEHAAIGAFLKGAEIPGERANALAERVAGANVFVAIGRRDPRGTR